MFWEIICLLLFSSIRANILNVSFHRQLIYQTYSSYCSNSSELLKFNCYWCSKQDPSFTLNISALLNDPKEDLFGYVGFSEVQRYFFRGTTDANPKDWFTNLDFELMSPYPQIPEIEVHRGFFTAYQLLFKNLERELKTKKCPRCNKILFLGHSLGGALAAIAAFDFKLNQRTQLPLSVFTIGQPRVGNTVFATFFQSFQIPMLRLTHKSDPVPHLPPLTFGYSHFPHEVWEHEELTFKECQDSSQEDPECSNSQLIKEMGNLIIATSCLLVTSDLLSLFYLALPDSIVYLAPIIGISSCVYIRSGYVLGVYANAAN